MDQIGRFHRLYHWLSATTTQPAEPLTVPEVFDRLVEDYGVEAAGEAVLR
jgi:hypothetical protein